MPTEIDWSPLLSKLGSPSVDRSASGTYETSSDDAIRVALEVVKSIFPDYTQKISPKILSDSTQNYTNTAEYSLLGNSIAFNTELMAGRTFPSSYVFTPTDSKKKKEVKVNFTTEEVLTNVNTILHELYHARSAGGWRDSGRTTAEKLFGISPEIESDVNKMAQSDKVFGVGNLYSMKPDYLDTEEFLANAVSLLDMRDRKVVPEKGPLREKLRTVEQIIQKYPQMGQYIENQRQPDIPSLKSGAPEPGTLGHLLESVFGGPRTERPQVKK